MVHPISTRGSTGKKSERTKEPEEKRKRKKMPKKKKSPRGFEPHMAVIGYLVPTKRRRAITSDHSDTWRYFLGGN